MDPATIERMTLADRAKMEWNILEQAIRAALDPDNNPVYYPQRQA